MTTDAALTLHANAEEVQIQIVIRTNNYIYRHKLKLDLNSKTNDFWLILSLFDREVRPEVMHSVNPALG